MIDRRQLEEGVRLLGLAPDEVQLARLLAYGELILKWSKVYNLTALKESELVLSHHLLDSLAVLQPLSRHSTSVEDLLDVGSGAGLPGVVIAIMRPDVNVTCLDAVAKKMAFVQQVAGELGLTNLRGVHQRVEDHRGAYQLITSRAFASLKDFFNGSAHLLAQQGSWMAMKGKLPATEIAELATSYDVFHVEQLEVPQLAAERCLVWGRSRSQS